MKTQKSSLKTPGTRNASISSARGADKTPRVKFQPEPEERSVEEYLEEILPRETITNGIEAVTKEGNIA